MAGYTEPMDFIPKDIRKELGLGEFNEEVMKEAEEAEKENEELNKRLREFVNKNKI